VAPRLKTDDAIRIFDQPSDIGWSYPDAPEGRQVLIGRPTGDGTGLSDVDRHLVLPGFGEQVPDRRHAYAL
jgi:hypothetical protein